MNLFKSAMSLIQSLNPAVKVKIVLNNSIFDSNTGIYTNVTNEYDAYAQVQAAEASVSDTSDTSTDTVNTYDVWLIDLSPTIVNSLMSTSIQNTSIILNNGIKIKAIEKGDYSYNGWIYIKGVQYADN